MGLWPIFVFGCVVGDMSREQSVEEIVRPVVEGMGYEFVGLEYFPQGRRSMLRLYIDAADGVTIDDCEQVSYQVSGVLDVEDPIKSAYVLEVSSPGDDRPLFRPEQYVRFTGRRVTVRLAAPQEGRRKYTGVLQGVSGENVLLDEDGVQVSVPFGQIEKARLVPEK